jgi:hypothetical protein
MASRDEDGPLRTKPPLSTGVVMHTLYVILLIIAAVCFLLATLSVEILIGGVKKRLINLVALGLLAWVLVVLIQLART